MGFTSFFSFKAFFFFSKFFFFFVFSSSLSDDDEDESLPLSELPDSSAFVLNEKIIMYSYSVDT